MHIFIFQYILERNIFVTNYYSIEIFLSYLGFKYIYIYILTLIERKKIIFFQNI